MLQFSWVINFLVLGTYLFTLHAQARYYVMLIVVSSRERMEESKESKL